VPFTLALGLLAAVGLNQGIGRIQSLFRVGYYLPVVTSIVAIAVIWRYLLHPDYGVVNAALAQIGIDGPNWLGQRSTALPSIIALGVWRNVGFDMVIFLAALQGINPALYEAARVDGARPHQIFFRITLPLLRPTILFLAVITSAGYLQLFEEPFVMTGGGPLDSTLSVAMYVYEQGFDFLNLGYASAVAYALFVAIVVLAFIQFRFLRSEDV
jgi:multiple sugar transport system permease protein